MIGVYEMTTQSRYLRLMAHCLTRDIFDDLDVDQLAARQDGRDWPPTAETMIGLPRLQNVIDCVTDVVQDGIEGDLCECGVWRGGASIMMAATLADLDDTSRQIWMCDSFHGLPRPDPRRYPADEGDLHSTYPQLAIPRPVVAKNLERYDLLSDRIRFIEGWFADTLPGPIGDLAVLRLDGDMYSSTIQTLEALHPKLVPGGYCIIDDYGGPGCTKAVLDYRDRLGITDPFRLIPRCNAVYWRRP